MKTYEQLIELLLSWRNGYVAPSLQITLSDTVEFMKHQQDMIAHLENEIEKLTKVEAAVVVKPKLTRKSKTL
jgi:nitrate/nitrite-specific signal transduction histidine kinase